MSFSRHSYAARPSIVPRPSSEMFVRSSPWNSASSGKAALPLAEKTVAPASISIRTWLRSSTVPEVYSPGGNTTVPPPAAAQASIARWIAGPASASRRPLAP
jgi:hypothetical protein